MTEQILWGNVSLVLDHPRMQQGYLVGRRLYYWQLYNWTLQLPASSDVPHPPQSPAPPAPQGPPRLLPISQVIEMIALPDEQGDYQLDLADPFDEDADAESVEYLLSVLVGYLSGPLFPETPEELRAREDELLACVTQSDQVPAN